MDNNNQVRGIKHTVNRWSAPLIENSRLIGGFFMTLLFIAVGAWFFKHEQHELRQIGSIIRKADGLFILTGLGTVLMYIAGQGLLYKTAFFSLGSKIPFLSSVILFLKRNFISVFIPAGGVTSMAFFSGTVESNEVSKSKIYLASSIYVFIGIASVAVISIPIFIYAFVRGFTGKVEMVALIFLVLLVIASVVIFRLLSQGRVNRYIEKFIPSLLILIQDLRDHSVSTGRIILAFVVSLCIDVVCILQMYLAMLALHADASFLFALIAYLISVLSLFISPFMRGLGAVEVSVAFILVKLGYSESGAVAITFMYRFFEFWMPLLFGILSFLFRINKLLSRIIPALLIFILGVINIISAITPAINVRVHALQDFIPLSAIAASNYLVLLMGAFLLLTAVFMFKGLRNAWWIALVLSILSVIGHITKAIDYEEATVAMFIALMLLWSRKEYNIRGNRRMHMTGVWTGLLSIIVVLIYGIAGFYFLDKRHFNIDFSLSDSITNTIQHFFLLNSGGPGPHSRFAKDFLLSINISGILSISFLFYTIISHYSHKPQTGPDELSAAKKTVSECGQSSLDYFKTYPDKMIFFTKENDAFISYKVAGNYAAALEDPVAPDEQGKMKCIEQFGRYCYDLGLKNYFYRVPETSLHLYHQKHLFLGQEAIVDLDTFTMEGGKYKTLRNAVNKLTERKYHSTVHLPPQKDGLMQKLKAVSEEWLHVMKRKELLFSQGMFLWDDIKQQTVITVENPEEMVIAFLNIIPDYKPGEGTYDLIRKTEDAPHGVLEFLLIELFRYFRTQGLSRVNLGFVPLGGMETPGTIGERSVKFAYEKLQPFAHYKRMRHFREKFFPEWENRYLIYSNDYDLLQVPAVLGRIFKAP